MSCGLPAWGKKEGSFLLEMLDLFGIRRGPACIEIDVSIPIVGCGIQKYWIHGIEVSEDTRRDKLCYRQQEFWRKSWNHGGNPELRLSKSNSDSFLVETITVSIVDIYDTRVLDLGCDWYTVKETRAGIYTL